MVNWLRLHPIRNRSSRSANERLKSTYSTWLVRGTVAAAAVHAVVFILWPVWEIARSQDDDLPLEVVQITPVAGFGGITDPGDGVVAALPTDEEVELAREEAGELFDEEELAEVTGVHLPLAAYAFVPEVVSESVGMAGEEESPSLILDRLAAISPDVTALVPDIGWPQIRNPTVITRFLRGRFNPMHRDAGASGHVAVAMWIDERGDVEWARVSSSSGDDRIDDIALALFEDVVAFSPARSRGKGIPVQVTISVPFTLPW